MTLAACCVRRGRPVLGRTYSTLLASQRQRAALTSERARDPRRLRRLSTVTTQLFDPPPRAQVRSGPTHIINGGRDLSIVNESPSGSCYWGNSWRRYEASDSYVSPRSISNSSLREVDDELTGEELATYLQYAHCTNGGLT
ncbi:Pheromone biosynthesis-activating neuropeptide receptor isoform B [Operophtera brumata]|uniref:Pheromone biosynthesis-activating neuropeptide receptor isoform B n=1 Tax=Operophtera brumata TaxID=104452 RepID=A0A0L7L4F6_OPEBR|nr:Pheromone biosynthesis-activating neuropeptide receptor isoform B [Operophtera brumata]